MKTIVCHGDSLTEGSDLNPNYTWPRLVENQINVKVINSGIGGDTSGGLLARFYHDVVRHKPDLVLILGGTNDLWWNLDINSIQANIFAMTCQAEYHNIVPVVGLPLPLCMETVRHHKMMAPIGGWENCVQKLGHLAEALASSAAESEIAAVDFYRPFLDNTGEVRGEYFLEDGLHPNKDGHLSMASEVSRLLKSTFYLA
jgi:lysophospholipase L1-like esterase